MNHQEYEKIKAIRVKIQKGKPTTFAERNVLNIYNKKMKKKSKNLLIPQQCK